MVLLLERSKLVVEGAGAASVAALLAGKVEAPGDGRRLRGALGRQRRRDAAGRVHPARRDRRRPPARVLDRRPRPAGRARARWSARSPSSARTCSTSSTCARASICTCARRRSGWCCRPTARSTATGSSPRSGEQRLRRQARPVTEPESPRPRSAPPAVWSCASATAGREVAVVHRPRYDDWSLPKGKLEPGEDWEDAALREVEEETGLALRGSARELEPAALPATARGATSWCAGGSMRPARRRVRAQRRGRRAALARAGSRRARAARLRRTTGGWSRGRRRPGRLSRTDVQVSGPRQAGAIRRRCDDRRGRTRSGARLDDPITPSKTPAGGRQALRGGTSDARAGAPQGAPALFSSLKPRARRPM